MHTPPPAPGYFLRTGPHVFTPSARTVGAWNSDEQHVSPLTGLLVHEIDRVRTAEGRPRLLLSRISFDILGRVALHEVAIHVRTTKPGRTVELMEATATIAERPVIQARAWFLAKHDTTTVAGGEPDPLPHPESLQPWPMSTLWPGGYIASIEVRPTGPRQPGRATAWVSTPVPLLAGEDANPIASYIALVDTANGIAVRRNPTEWMFPNVDLTIHFHRQPEGRWTGLDTTVVFGNSGQGVTSTTLHDTQGPVGCAQQILTVRPMQPQN